MGSGDKCETVIMIKGLGDVLAESVSRSSRRDSPAAPIVRVGPEQVTHRTFMRHLLYPVQSSDVIEGINGGGEPAVEAEDLVVDKGGEGEVIEEVGEVFPNVGVTIFAQALVVEAINLSNLPGLVVAAKDGDALRVADLERNEESDGLDGEVAAVNVVTYMAP